MPPLLCSDAALMPLVGFKAQPVHDGVGQRGATRRHGQGQTACTERLETEVVGLIGLTTDDRYSTPAPERQANRRDFQPHPSHAVVVRQWHGQAYGPGGKPVLLTNAPVARPLRVFDDDDERSLVEHCWMKACTPPWDWGHPPPKTARAVQVHVMCTLLLCALATAYRRPCARTAVGDEPVGWPRGRRQLLEQSRDQVIVFAQG